MESGKDRERAREENKVLMSISTQHMMRLTSISNGDEISSANRKRYFAVRFQQANKKPLFVITLYLFQLLQHAVSYFLA
jgi:hypothetical protein